MARDAIDMAGVLADQSIGGFDVTSVLDGTAREIRLAVQDFLDGRGREDLLLVYLSGHGLLDKYEKLYFAGTDTSEDHLAATGVEAAWLWDRLDESRSARQVVILDCCNSGAFGRLGAKGAAGTDEGLKQFVSQGRGRAMLMASRARQSAWVQDAAGGVAGSSVFTSALVEGLRTGQADVNGDGYISVDEAYTYAYDKVLAADVGQIPQRSIGGEGTLLLARNPAGLAAVPDDLRVALNSAYPHIRLGAVDVLGEWLTGPDPAMTLIAYEILAHMAAHGVPDVATAARELLDRWPRELLDRWQRTGSEAANALAQAQMNSNVELTRNQILSILNSLNLPEARERGQQAQAKMEMERQLFKSFIAILASSGPPVEPDH